jgi:hypothetical protein
MAMFPALQQGLLKHVNIHPFCFTMSARESPAIRFKPLWQAGTLSPDAM